MAQTRQTIQKLEDEPSSEEAAKQGSFTDSLLTDDERKQYQFAKDRINELQQTRVNHYGMNLDTLWAQADRDYMPHRLKPRGKRVVATDEEKGWRSAFVELGSSNWQADVSQSNPYVKIQTALSILVDQNPSGVFTPASKKFQATNEIMRQLYQRSWEYAQSKAQLKLFVFNLAKYGWAVGRTYPLYLTSKSRILTKYDPQKPEASEYDEREVVEYNDIFRENLDPRNVWIDDMAKPSNKMSLRDWTWRKVYEYDEAKKEFGHSKWWDYVMAGGNTDETVGVKKLDGNSLQREVSKKQKLVEVLFYENRTRDIFIVLANGVPVVLEPLPIADANGVKRLSCWQTYWNLRHSQSPYGIGIYEAIRFDQAMLDRIRNMTVDQLTLSIYKMFFYQGTQSLSETGEIKIQPGVGKQVLDPKNVNWLQVPGPGQDAYLGIEMFRKDVDEASGITDPLLGQVTGKTAFEIAQAKESALKRLKNPLDSITEALNDEGYITIALIQLLYSIPEVYEITDQALIEAYLQETGSDPELYERVPSEPDADGNPTDVFQAKVYREFPLNLGEDEKGNLIETKETQFFRTKPSALDWQGVISIKSQSVLTPSKQIDKSLELEMYNMLIPLLAQPPELYHKVANNIVKLYDKDPRDILPDMWLEGAIQQQEVAQDPNALFVGADQPTGTQPGLPSTNAPHFVAQPTAPASPTGVGASIVNKLQSGLRGV